MWWECSGGSKQDDRCVRWDEFFYYFSFFPQVFDRHNGISLFIWSDVPLGKGVSSSASVEIACMKAAAEVWSVL
jgi:mevalonate kinase